LHFKLTQPPCGFTWSNISNVKIIPDFVVFGRSWVIVTQSHCCTITAFVDIFVEVFECPNCTAYLDVDVGIVALGKIRIVRNNGTVIVYVSSDLHSSSVVSPSINRIPIFVPSGLFGKVFGVSFRAPSVLDASLRGARAMEHVCFDDTKEFWIDIRIGEFSADNTINFLNSPKFALLI
jgi:hypothetical protein